MHVHPRHSWMQEYVRVHTCSAAAHARKHISPNAEDNWNCSLERQEWRKAQYRMLSNSNYWHPRTPSHRAQVEKRTVLENLDQVLLAMDEIIDGG